MTPTTMPSVPGRLLTLRLYYLASFAALGAYAPFFPRWLEARGVEGLSMGVIAGVIPAMGVLGPPAIGVLADALGLRGSLLRLCCMGACMSISALAITSSIGRAPTLFAIFACVLAYGIFRSPMVMLADVIALERAAAAGTSYGKLRLWGSIGFLTAAIAVGRAVDPRAPAALPASIAAMLAVALLAAWTLPASPDRDRAPAAGEARSLLTAPDFAVFLAFSLLAQIAGGSYDLCFSLHLRDLGATDAETGVAWAAGVLFEVALMVFAERLLARFSAPRLIALSLAGAALRWALLATITSRAILFALQPLHAISFALWWIASLAWTKERAPARALATAQGLFSAAVAAGSVIGMPAWGALYRRSGGAFVFACSAAIALLAAILAHTWSAWLPRRAQAR